VTADGVDITLSATSEDVTVANLTSHAYFHLDGAGAGVIDEQLLEVAAERYTPVDAHGIPTGDHEPVEGTPFDFRTPKPIGPAVREDHPQLRDARGVDHNYVIDGEGLRTHAVVTSRVSGLRLEVLSDQPGLQVYTGNFLDGSALDATGRMLRQGDGLALEPQLFPDSPNRPDFPSATLRPGETYRSRIQWRITPA
jgi:aldose 1-epimerase